LLLKCIFESILKFLFDVSLYDLFKIQMQQNKIPDGQRTKVIYTLIKEAKYQEVISFLLRPSTISVTSFNSAQEVVPCHCLPTATT